ncbi:MAG: DinB family protein [Ignavibacteriales bacterium]|nr:DinB family protein [Ignavibacteriales bacterium]
MRKINKASLKNNPYAKQLTLYVVDKTPLQVFESTPKEIAKAIRGLAKNQLQKSPKKDKWSIAQIVAHLTDGEIVLSYRFRKVISEPGSKIEFYNQNKWSKNLHYEKADCKKKLALFTAIRKENVELLKSLSSKEWKRFGMHSERGKETIEKMLLLYAGHDMNHLKQIESIKSLFSR